MQKMPKKLNFGLFLTIFLLNFNNFQYFFNICNLLIFNIKKSKKKNDIRINVTNCNKKLQIH